MQAARMSGHFRWSQNSLIYLLCVAALKLANYQAAKGEVVDDELSKTMRGDGEFNQIVVSSFGPVDPLPVGSEKASERENAQQQISVVNNQSNIVFNDPQALTTPASFNKEASTTLKGAQEQVVASSQPETTPTPRTGGQQQNETVKDGDKRPTRRRRRKRPNLKSSTMISYSAVRLPALPVISQSPNFRQQQLMRANLAHRQPVMLNLVHQPSGGLMMPLLPPFGGESFMFDASLLPPTLAGSLAASSVLSGRPAEAPALDPADASSGLEELPEQLNYPEPSSPAALRDSFEPPANNNNNRDKENELAAFGSQAASEFETTLKQLPAGGEQPALLRELVPIEIDTSSAASAPAGSSSPAPIEEAEEGEKGETDEEGQEAGLAVGGQLAGNGSEPLPAAERESRALKPTRLDGGASGAPGPTGSALGRELLVGPFKSEAEAPASITLSGVLYQKSGRKRPQDNLSASSSASAASLPSSATGLPKTNNWPALSQQQPQTTAIYTSAPAAAAQISVLLGTLRSNLETGQEQPEGKLIDSGRPDAKELMQTLEAYYGPLAANRPLPATSGGGRLSLDRPKMNGNYQSAAALNGKGATSTSGHLQLATGATVSSNALEPQTIWPASNKKTEQYYLGAFAAGSGQEEEEAGYQMAGSKQHQQKAAGPIVIVQKDVKPVKYHLLRAYLKLRRLLRPFEATYVFPNEPGGFLRRLSQFQAPLHKG